MKHSLSSLTHALRTISGVALLVLVTLALAGGQTAMSESFAYPAGILVGRNGGTGWLGAWSSIGTTTSPVLSATGLTYPGYITSGGAVTDTGGTSYAAVRKWFDPATPFANGTTIWFSCLLRYNVSHNSDILVLPFGKSGATSDGFGVAINTRPTANSSTWGNDPYVFLRQGTTNYGVSGSASGAGLIGSIGLGKPLLIVGRFTLSTSPNADVLDIWVNQTEAPTADAPLRKTGLSIYRGTATSAGNLLLYSGFSAQGGVDEIKVGSSYAAVVSGLTISAVPTIALSSPNTDSVFSAPASISLAARVEANGRAVSKVQFFNGTTLLAEDLVAPYEWTWTNVPVSTPAISARLIDANGYVMGSAPVSVYVLDNSSVTFDINTQAARRPISPLIYGTNNVSDPAQLRELNFTINRRGGEVESRYDYQTNSHNICHNWYFTSSSASGAPAADVGRYIQASVNGGADVIVAVPTIGWMPKPGTYSFSQAKYGLQTANEPYGLADAGNGILQLNASGNPIPYNPATAVADRAANVGNPTANLTPFQTDVRLRSDRTDANQMPADPVAYQAGYVDTLIARWGRAATGGVRYYALDNEPKLWDSTHRDVRGGDEPTKEEIRDYVIAYGSMIKDRDPTSQIMAADEWGWLDWKGYYPWLLAQMQAHHNTSGRRVLDFLTLHYYANVDGTEGSLAKLFSLNQSTRSLWDPRWVDKSWINSVINLIPNMRTWVAANYPGTKIGITEYNWGYDNTIAGAVIQAEVLGIFGREGLDLATRWGSSANSPSNLIFKAMKMYRNYDGLRSSFGDTSVSVTSSVNVDEMNAFAAERSSDGALTIIALNKQPSGTRATTFNVGSFSHRGLAQSWRLDASGSITRQADLSLSGDSLVTSLPPQSVTIYVLPSAESVVSPQVANPSPVSGAIGISTSPMLSWNAAAHASLYHLYIGTSVAAVNAATKLSPEYRGASATPNFDLNGLAGTTTYYWRIDAEATGGVTAGSIWSFTTAIPPRGIVTLNASDAFGSSSYNAPGNWSNASAPSNGNDYFTSNKEMRSPVGASGTTAFGGYSLSLDSGGTLTTKGANNNNLSIDRLVLNGGRIRVGDQNTLVTLSGAVAEVRAASTLDADQASRVMVFSSPLSGSARLSIASKTSSGGIVRLTGDQASFTGPWTIETGATLQVGNGGTSGSLGSGDVILNGALTFNRSGLLTVPGGISGSGSLSLQSSLALTLDGVNSYTGSTTASAGALFVDGSLGNTAVTIDTAATLGGTGSVAGPVTVLGTLSPGVSGLNSTASLSFGDSLTLASSAICRFEINRASSVPSDTVTVFGALHVAGELVVTNMGAALVAGDRFAIFNKAPTTGSFAQVTLPSLSPGLLWRDDLAIDGTVSVVAVAVGSAVEPSPASGARDVSLDAILSWTAGVNAVSHAIYFGTDHNAVALASVASPEYQGARNTTSWQPVVLDGGRTYHWRVDEIGAATTTTGTVWSFTTALADPYQSWANAKNLTPGVNDAGDADPDRDGLQNLMEFILGGDPLMPVDAARLPSAEFEGDNLIFSFYRDDRSEPGTTLLVQYGDNLRSWTNIPIGSISRFIDGVAVSIIENETTPDQVKVSIPRTRSAQFVRLKASRP